MACLCVPNIERDTVPARDRRTMWRYMFPKNEIRVINTTDYKAYVIVTPTRDFDMTSLNVQRLGGIRYEENGATIQEQSSGIGPETDLLFELETKKVYVTVYINLEDGWVRWRRKKCVKAYRDDFVINIKDPELVVGVRYTEEEFMNLLKIST